jgi:hypothetical protein
MRLRAVVLLLLGAGAAAVAAGPAGAQSVTPPCPRAVDFAQAEFPAQPVIDNTWLPLTPGTRLTLEGRANRGGGPLPHTVSFTTTDITKVINGVNTLVVWDVDINEGELAETELAFFAQDTNGNVWNLGEYPEEYDGGDFVGAPNTWISGLGDAEGGIHMVAQPQVGQQWLQGWVPSIEFLDCARVYTIRHQVCVPFSCYSPYLRTNERSPLDPAGGIQTKFHAKGVGIVQVGAVDDPEGETLVLTDMARLGPAQMMDARVAAMELDERGYFTSGVYAQTPRAKLPPGVVLPPRNAGGRRGGSGSAGPGGKSSGPQSGKPGRRGKRYTAKVDHPLVPLTTVRHTVFTGHEGNTRTRVVSRVLKKTRRVAGVRVAIVDVREFEDRELVEHTRDYYAQDRKGRVWYFGESVDDIENGKVVGHEGQWFAGKNGAKPGLFMPAKPKVGKVFEQEQAPGVAEDRSKVVRVGLDVTTPAGQFDGCIKTRDFAPLDRRTEFKFYCAGVGLVREKPADGRLDLVRYR